MTGKRQHHVPRFLQRGFLYNGNDRAEQTWLHRRGVKARLVGIHNIGVEGWFYSGESTDGSSTLDDFITEQERDLSVTVERMRQLRPEAVVEAGTAARCVVHLVMRTNHIRSLTLDGVESAADEVQSLFGDPDRLAKMLGLDTGEPSPLFIDAVQKATARFEFADPSPSVTAGVLFDLIRQHRDLFLRQAPSAVAQVFSDVRRDLGQAISDAHNNVLPRALDEPSGWISRLSTFRWNVEAAPGLILPDAVALAAAADGRLVPVVLTNAKTIDAVVMPISTTRILVGIYPDRLPLDLTRFNMHAAAACTAFFISARPLDEENLSDAIGTASETALRRALEQAGRLAEPK